MNEYEGWIEVGYDIDSPLNSFICALDTGGMPWEGKNSYNGLDEAFQKLDSALAKVL